MPRQKSANELEALRQKQRELTKQIREADTGKRENADAERRKLLVGRLIL